MNSESLPESAVKKVNNLVRDAKFAITVGMIPILGLMRWRQFDGQSNCLTFWLRCCVLVIRVPVPLLFCPFRVTIE